jgi:hypothetical protein
MQMMPKINCHHLVASDDLAAVRSVLLVVVIAFLPKGVF